MGTQKASSQSFIDTSSVQDTGLVYRPADYVSEIQQVLPVKQDYQLARIVFTHTGRVLIQRLPYRSGPATTGSIGASDVQQGFQPPVTAFCQLQQNLLFPPLLARRQLRISLPLLRRNQSHPVLPPLVRCSELWSHRILVT